MTFQNAKVTPGAGEAPEDSGTFNKINGIIGVTGSNLDENIMMLSSMWVVSSRCQKQKE